MYKTSEMTYDEQVVMYKQLKKRELIKMLIEANRIISNLTLNVVQPPYHPCLPIGHTPPSHLITWCSDTTWCGDTSPATTLHVVGKITPNIN